MKLRRLLIFPRHHRTQRTKPSDAKPRPWNNSARAGGMRTNQYLLTRSRKLSLVVLRATSRWERVEYGRQMLHAARDLAQQSSLARGGAPRKKTAPSARYSRTRSVFRARHDSERILRARIWRRKSDPEKSVGDRNLVVHADQAVPKGGTWGQMR